MILLHANSHLLFFFNITLMVSQNAELQKDYSPNADLLLIVYCKIYHKNRAHLNFKHAQNEQKLAQVGMKLLTKRKCF